MNESSARVPAFGLIHILFEKIKMSLYHSQRSRQVKFIWTLDFFVPSFVELVVQQNRH